MNGNANGDLTPGIIDLLGHRVDDSLLAPIESATFRLPALTAVPHHFYI